MIVKCGNVAAEFELQELPGSYMSYYDLLFFQEAFFELRQDSESIYFREGSFPVIEFTSYGVDWIKKGAIPEFFCFEALDDYGLYFGLAKEGNSYRIISKFSESPHGTIELKNLVALFEPLASSLVSEAGKLYGYDISLLFTSEFKDIMDLDLPKFIGSRF